MEQEDKPTETQDSQTEGGAELTTANNSEPTAQVVVKKSGGLSLFVALLALGISGYLLYQDWQASQMVSEQSQQTASKPAFDEHVSKINDRHQQLQVTLSQQAQEISALDNRLNQLRETTAKQTNDTVPASTFDNSENQALFTQLQQRLNEQNTVIQQLQSQLASQPATNPGTTAHEVLPDNDRYHSQATIESLLVADLLLQSGQLDQAVKVLEDHLAAARIRPGIISQINQLIGRIKRTAQPDTQTLAERLQVVKQQLSTVGLATEAADGGHGDQDAPWYTRFVSVKKIAEDSQIQDSTALALAKAQISQHLFQAQLALTLAEQDLWSGHLQQAVQLLQTQLPDQQSIINELNQLSAELVKAVVPDDINTAAIIDELNGLR